MLVTKQPVLRRFWYPVIPARLLADGPKPFRLLGQDIVLWMAADGRPAALLDRCCHRTAQLSKGYVEGGSIVCGYHGWAYDGAGACIRIPQARTSSAKTGAGKTGFVVPSFRAALRYGHVWVCLGEPLADIPRFEEAEDGRFRRIDQFYEVWRCAGLRLMENSFDNAHIAFVHRESFGNVAEPEPASIKVTETAEGLDVHSSVPVMNRGLANAITQTAGAATVRNNHAKWYLPFTRKLGITYPNGLKHSIVTAATPIDDASSMIVQFVFRNDTEAETKAADVIAFDRKVTDEDRPILESTEFDVPLEAGTGREFNMPSDRPGLIMRRRLLELLRAHGETEMTATPPPTFAGSIAAE